MEIRKATMQDVVAMTDLETNCFSVPWTQEMLVSELSKNNTHFVVAIVDNQIVGYAGMWIVLDEGEVARVAVLPTLRRGGVGRALTDCLLAHAKDAQVVSVFLEVRESNEAARCLYKKLAFQEIGIRKHYYTNPKENAILMQCDTTLN